MSLETLCRTKKARVFFFFFIIYKVFAIGIGFSFHRSVVWGGIKMSYVTWILSRVLLLSLSIACTMSVLETKRTTLWGCWLNLSQKNENKFVCNITRIKNNKKKYLQNTSVVPRERALRGATFVGFSFPEEKAKRNETDEKKKKTPVLLLLLRCRTVRAKPVNSSGRTTANVLRRDARRRRTRSRNVRRGGVGARRRRRRRRTGTTGAAYT